MTQTRLSRHQADVLFDLSGYPHDQAGQADHRSAMECTSHDRRLMMRDAASRIRRLAVRREQRAAWRPEQHVDHQTSMADARIALCVTQGNSLEDIDPGSGYSTSRPSYDRVRHSWISSIKHHGFNAMYEQEALDKAVAFWTERRPQFTNGDDWLVVGMAAHREYSQSDGRVCDRPSCDEHGDAS